MWAAVLAFRLFGGVGPTLWSRSRFLLLSVCSSRLLMTESTIKKPLPGQTKMLPGAPRLTHQIASWEFIPDCAAAAPDLAGSSSEVDTITQSPVWGAWLCRCTKQSSNFSTGSNFSSEQQLLCGQQLLLRAAPSPQSSTFLSEQQLLCRQQL